MEGMRRVLYDIISTHIRNDFYLRKTIAAAEKKIKKKKPNILLMKLKCSANIYICRKNVIFKPGVLAGFI